MCPALWRLYRYYKCKKCKDKKSKCRLMIAHRVGVGRVLRIKLIFTFLMDWCVGRTLLLFAHYSLYFMDQVPAHFSDFIGAIENCISFKMRKGFVKNCD